MQNRIEELARKAHLDWCIQQEWDRKNIQEFAELLIKECCDIFVELRTRPADLAVRDVKLHFGIKE